MVKPITPQPAHKPGKSQPEKSAPLQTLQTETPLRPRVSSGGSWVKAALVGLLLVPTLIAGKMRLGAKTQPEFTPTEPTLTDGPTASAHEGLNLTVDMPEEWLRPDAQPLDVELSGASDDAPPEPAPRVSPGTEGTLTALSGLTVLNMMPAFLSHAEFLRGSMIEKVFQRHDSLLGENLSLRGLVQVYNYASGAFPDGLKEATPQARADWSAAALLGFNVRMLWETAESAYVFPDRPLSGCYDSLKAKVDTAVGHGALPLTGFAGLPIARRMDQSEALRMFNKYIGWGIQDSKGPGHVSPKGFGNADALLWFESRFHFTTLLSEFFNAVGIGEGDKDYLWWDNGVGSVLNIWITPQVGGLAVAITQLVPIIGRVNAIQHGTTGPDVTQWLSKYTLGRQLTYSIATPLLTWPQYDIVMSLMANVPNGQGGITGSGLYGCIEKFKRPCVGGPTSVLHETSGGSNWAFVPLTMASVFQMGLLWHLMKKAGPQDATGSVTAPVQTAPEKPAEQQPLSPRDFKSYTPEDDVEQGDIELTVVHDEGKPRSSATEV